MAFRSIYGVRLRIYEKFNRHNRPAFSSTFADEQSNLINRSIGVAFNHRARLHPPRSMGILANYTENEPDK